MAPGSVNTSIDRDEAHVGRVIEDAMVPRLDEEAERGVQHREIDTDAAVEAEVAVVNAEAANEVRPEGTLRGPEVVDGLDGGLEEALAEVDDHQVELERDGPVVGRGPEPAADVPSGVEAVGVGGKDHADGGTDLEVVLPRRLGGGIGLLFLYREARGDRDSGRDCNNGDGRGHP